MKRGLLFLILIASAAPAGAEQGDKKKLRQASAGSARTPPAQQPSEPGPEVWARRVAVGFSGVQRLREAVLGRLIQSGRYRVDASPQIPGLEGGLFVGGHLLQLRAQGGFVDCRVRYFLAAQPDRDARFIDSVAASVPLAGGAPDQASALDAAQARCLDEIAGQIAGQIANPGE